MQSLFTYIVVCLAMQAAEDPASTQPPVYRNTSGFACSLLAVPDMDGDGVEEVVVADWTGSYKESGRPELFVYSPGKERVHGLLELGEDMEVGHGGHILASISSGSDETKFAILASVRGKGIPHNYILVYSLKSMRVTTKVSLAGVPASMRSGSIWGLETGDVLLHCGSGAYVVNITSGECDLRTRLPGHALSLIGDLDDDGVFDCVATNRGTHEVYSLGTRKVLFSFTEQPGGKFSRSTDVSFFPAGDVDGDGKPEFVMASRVLGSYTDGGTFIMQECLLSLRSGATGRALFELGHFKSEDTSIRLNVLACPDQDGDGVADLVVAVSAPFEQCSKWLVISGADGKVIAEHLWSTRKPSNEIAMTWGHSMVNVGDLDEDGIGDFVISRSTSSTMAAGIGAVLLCSSKSGQLATITRKEAFPEEFEE